MTNDHLLNLLSCLFVPFPYKRCDMISPLPHLLSITSRQVGTKLFFSITSNFPPTWREVDLCSPDNSGQLVRNFCCRSLLGNVRQLVPHFQRRASIKRAPTWRNFITMGFSKMCANLAHIFAFDSGQIIRAIMERISNFGPTWSEVPGVTTWTIMVQVFTSAQLRQKFPPKNGDHHGHK